VRGTLGGVINELPDPVLTQVFSLKAVLGPPLDFGEVLAGHRRVAPLVGGTFTGPELNGGLLPGGSATWQTALPDGTVVAEMRYTLQTDRGALLYVQSSGVGQGDRDLVHAATRIETSAPDLDWLTKGMFITVAGHTEVNMLFEAYLVG
jgi:hypothetical protein